MDKKVLNKLLEGVDEQLFTEEKLEELSSMIEDVVNTRVEAKTKEFAEKESFFLEEAKKLKQSYDIKERKMKKSFEAKEKVLQEEARSFAQRVVESSKVKEQIMLEEIENFKGEARKVIAQEAALYRKNVEKLVSEEASKYRDYIEGIALEEAENFKVSQDSALAEEVSGFKEEMVNKISQFLESVEMKKAIPEHLLEAEAKLAVYQPLVESVVGAFGKHGVKVDSTSYNVIKEAKKENEQLKESVNAKSKDIVHLQAKVNDLNKKLKINELTEGMTSQQKSKTFKLLEGYSLNELQDKFEKIRDIVISESVKGSKKEETHLVESKKTVPTKKPVVSEAAKKVVDKLEKRSIKESMDPEMNEYVSRLNRQLVSD